eukprot:scaffold416515_cov17-Prasinocladus_malaysianus.AAC.1
MSLRDDESPVATKQNEFGWLKAVYHGTFVSKLPLSNTGSKITSKPDERRFMLHFIRSKATCAARRRHTQTPSDC